MFTVRRLNLYFVGLAIGLLVIGSFGSIASESNTDTKILLTSRFILWDTNEKMIDPNFDIHILYFNYTNNNTANYEIIIDNEKWDGIVINYTTVHIYINNSDKINSIIININNNTVYTVNDIVVITGLSGNNVFRAVSEFLISLNPFEWSSKEWNIFFGVVIASLLTLPISLRFVKYYKKKFGVTVIK